MKKSVKRILAVIGCIAVIPFAVGSCSIAVSHAEDNIPSGEELLDSTRYPAIGFNTIEKMVGVLQAIESGAIPSDLYNDVYANALPRMVMMQDVWRSTEEANRSTTTYTIKQSSCILCKRELIYPYDDMKETDYLYIYQSGSSGAPQQFGDNWIQPNTMLLIRDTNFMGVKVCSFPLTSYCHIGGGSPNNIIINTPPNELFYYDTPDGQMLEYVYFASNSHYFSVPIVNNSVNTIRNDWLIRAYQTNLQEYRDYIGADGAILDDFEVLLGTGYDNQATGRYNRTMCQSNSGAFTVQPWYISSAYFNDSTSSSHINQYYSTDTNIDPSKPPAYVVPNDNPLHYGNELSPSTINNYYDYGITYDNDEFSLDPDILAGALGALVDPDFNGAFGGVFSAQPQLGLGFDTPLDLNLPDLVGDYLQSITVYPPTENTRPLVPVVTTLSEWDMLPTYTTETFPVAVQDGYSTLTLHTTDFTDAIGVTSVFLLLALIGLLIYAVF